jgi:hypothetical protein
MKSSSGCHDAPPSVVFQIPPPTLPAYITWELFGLITIVRIRPPMLPGPRLLHRLRSMFAADPETVASVVAAPVEDEVAALVAALVVALVAAPGMGLVFMRSA